MISLSAVKTRLATTGLSTPDIWVAGTTSLAAAFLLAGYEFMRSPSNTLFKAAWGADKLPVVMALMPLGVIAALFLYNRVLSKFGPRKTLLFTSLASAILTLACYGAITNGSRIATGVLYIVREVYIVLIIEQYWSFINSSLSKDSAKKLNGPITGIASIGAIAGGLIASVLAVPIGTVHLLLFAAASLVPAALLSDFGFRRAGEPAPSEAERATISVLPKGRMGFRELKTTPLLTLILLIVILSQVISAALYLDFQSILQKSILDPDLETAWSTRFYSYVNSVALVLNFVGAPLLMRFLPVTGAHLLIPVIHVTTCAILFASPTLGVAATAFMLFKGFDYSLFRVAKELLYIPLSFEARYRAKEFIDVFGFRFSKGATALLIAFTQAAGVALAAGSYALIALVAALVWLSLLPALRRRYKEEESLPATEILT